MMKVASVFGSEDTDLSSVAAAVGQALDVQPEQRFDTLCGFHYRFNRPGVEASLVHNLADPTYVRDLDRYHVPEHKECSIILAAVVTCAPGLAWSAGDLNMKALSSRRFPDD